MTVQRDLVSVKAILFDLDGTLVDSVPGIEYSMRVALAAVGLAADTVNLRSLIGPPVRSILQQILEGAPLETIDRAERAFRNSYDTEGWQKTSLFDGVEATLARLTELGVKSFVVTNKPAVPTRKIVAYLKVDCFLTDIVSPDSLQRALVSKKDLVDYVIRTYQLLMAQTVLVGDSLDDARAAQACGLRFAAFARGYGEAHKQTEVPVALICSEFADVLKLINLEQPNKLHLRKEECLHD